MSSRTSSPRGTGTHARARRRTRTAATVRAAAERAVDTVFRSEEAFALLISRLEAAGWHVERGDGDDASLTPPARAR